MPLVNSNISYTGLVEKYIGSAYDVVALVAYNIEALKELATALENGSLDDLMELAPEILELIDDITYINGVYWGAYPDTPLLDKNGDPADEGDLYYNTTVKRLKIYSAGSWVNLGDVTQTVEFFKMVVDTGIPYTINLQNPYVIGSHNVSVYKNGELQVSNSSSSTDYEYIEANPYAITFPNGLLLDDEIQVKVNTDISNTAFMVEVKQTTYIDGGINQTLITIPEGLTYAPGAHNLNVHIERLFQVVDEDYTEVSPTQIQLSVPINLDDKIIFTIGSIISNVPQVAHMLMQPTKPTESLYSPGQQWWNTDKGRMFVLTQDSNSLQWVSTSGEDTIIYPV